MVQVYTDFKKENGGKNIAKPILFSQKRAAKNEKIFLKNRI